MSGQTGTPLTISMTRSSTGSKTLLVKFDLPLLNLDASPPSLQVFVSLDAGKPIPSNFLLERIIEAFKGLAQRGDPLYEYGIDIYSPWLCILGYNATATEEEIRRMLLALLNEAGYAVTEADDLPDVQF